MNKNVVLAMLLIGVSSCAWAQSFLTTRLDDNKAVYLTKPEF